MRIEIRVRPIGMDWEVINAESTTSHATREAALRQAREQARVAWVEAHRPSTVKELRDRGWETDVFYGLEGLYA